MQLRQEIQLHLSDAFFPYPKGLASNLQVLFFKSALSVLMDSAQLLGWTESLIDDKMSVAVARGN